MAHEEYPLGKIQRVSAGELSEFQMDNISLQRDIPIEQNRSEGADAAAKEFNIRLLADIDERWETSREEGADVAKKPLIDYDEWRVIDGCLYREERESGTC